MKWNSFQFFLVVVGLWNVHFYELFFPNSVHLLIEIPRQHCIIAFFNDLAGCPILDINLTSNGFRWTWMTSMSNEIRWTANFHVQRFWGFWNSKNQFLKYVFRPFGDHFDIFFRIFSKRKCFWSKTKRKTKKII